MYVGVQWRDCPDDRSIVRGRLLLWVGGYPEQTERRQTVHGQKQERTSGRSEAGGSVPLCRDQMGAWKAGSLGWEGPALEMCNKCEQRLRGPGGQHGPWNITTGAGPPLQRQREWPLLGMGSPFHKSLRNAGRYPTTRSPSVVQTVLISGHSDFLRPNSNKESRGEWRAL